MTEEVRIESDEAIEGEEEDELGRGKFVGELASLIKNYKKDNSECLTMDISGEWGEGKTSVVNLLKENLENEKDIKFIDFNPWKTYSKRENIEDELYKEIIYNVAIFKYLIQSLFQPYNLFHPFRYLECLIIKITLFIQKYKTFFLLLILLIVYNMFFMNYIFVLSFKIKLFFTKILKENLKYFIYIFGICYSCFKYYHSLINKKEAIKPILEGSKITYILKIDDIDRLNKKEIIKLFNCIKSNIDLPHFIIIFLYERNLINDILKEHYKQDSFLDKIVRIQRDLPAVDYIYIEDYFVKGLNEKTDNQFIDTDYYMPGFYDLISNITKHIFKNNLRNIKRFLNQFYADYLMIKENKENIDIKDFMLIELIKHFENRLYNFIKENGDYFIEIYDTQNKEEKNKKNNELKDKIIKNENIYNVLIIIIDYLFLKRGSGLTNRINDSESFDRYFRLDIDIEKLTLNEYNNLEDCFSNYKNFVIKFEEIKGKKLNKLKENNIKNKNITSSIVNSFFDFFEKIEFFKPSLLNITRTNDKEIISNLIAIMIYLYYQDRYFGSPIGKVFVKFLESIEFIIRNNITVKKFIINNVPNLLDTNIILNENTGESISPIDKLGYQILFANIIIECYQKNSINEEDKDNIIKELQNNIETIFNELIKINITENSYTNNFINQLIPLFSCIAKNDYIGNKNLKTCLIKYFDYINLYTHIWIFSKKEYFFIKKILENYYPILKKEKDFKLKFFEFLSDKNTYRLLEANIDKNKTNAESVIKDILKKDDLLKEYEEYIKSAISFT